MAEWIESVLSGFESQLSEVRAHDLPPHLGRTEPAVILGASAIWQGGEGPGHEALLGRAAGQARGSGFERRHSTAIKQPVFFIFAEKRKCLLLTAEVFVSSVSKSGSAGLSGSIRGPWLGPRQAPVPTDC